MRSQELCSQTLPPILISVIKTEINKFILIMNIQCFFILKLMQMLEILDIFAADMYLFDINKQVSLFMKFVLLLHTWTGFRLDSCGFRAAPIHL